jgi:hypothetical protein
MRFDDFNVEARGHGLCGHLQLEVTLTPTPMFGAMTMARCLRGFGNFGFCASENPVATDELLRSNAWHAAKWSIVFLAREIDDQHIEFFQTVM